jgi:hypothetical protein
LIKFFFLVTNAHWFLEFTIFCTRVKHVISSNYHTRWMWIFLYIRIKTIMYQYLQDKVKWKMKNSLYLNQIWQNLIFMKSIFQGGCNTINGTQTKSHFQMNEIAQCSNLGKKLGFDKKCMTSPIRR